MNLIVNKKIKVNLGRKTISLFIFEKKKSQIIYISINISIIYFAFCFGNIIYSIKLEEGFLIGLGGTDQLCCNGFPVNSSPKVLYELGL